MEKFEKLVADLNDLQITQNEGDWVENLPEEIYNQHFKDNFKQLDSGLDIDKHRWYETSVSVIEIYGRILGVRFVTQMYSESSDLDSIFWHLVFFEMKAVQVTTYEPLEIAK